MELQARGARDQGCVHKFGIDEGDDAGGAKRSEAVSDFAWVERRDVDDGAEPREQSQHRTEVVPKGVDKPECFPEAGRRFGKPEGPRRYWIKYDRKSGQLAGRGRHRRLSVASRESARQLMLNLTGRRPTRPPRWDD